MHSARAWNARALSYTHWTATTLGTCSAGHLASKYGFCLQQRPKLLIFLVRLPARLTATSCVFLATAHGGFVSPLAVDQEHMMHTQGLKGACANPNTSAALSKAMSTTAEERKCLNPSDSPYGVHPELDSFSTSRTKVSAT